MLKVFLTDLHAYNAGFLIGRWIQLPLTDEELSQAITEVFTEGEEATGEQNHEEYFLTDYEWQSTHVFEVHEYANLHDLNKDIEALEALEPTDIPKVAFLLEEGISSKIEYAMEKIDDIIIYEDCNMTEIAEQYIDDYVDLNGYQPIIVNHIDYEGMGRDLELDGSYYHVGSDIYQYIA